MLPHARWRGLHVSKLGVKLRYEAIVFDKDGVLVDTEPYYDQRRRAFFAEVGIDDSAFPSFYGSNNEVIWKTVVPNDPVRRRALCQQFRLKFANASVPYARLCVPGMREVPHACRGLGLRMGLASASPRWVVDDFLSQLQLTDFFDVALSGEECPANKPAPRRLPRGHAPLGRQSGQDACRRGLSSWHPRSSQGWSDGLRCHAPKRASP